MKIEEDKILGDSLPIKTAVVGFGYIGSVIAASIAVSGAEVVCVEKNKEIINKIKSGESHIVEEGFNELLKKAIGSGRFQISDDWSSVGTCEVVIVCVGTPLGENGAPDLSALNAAFKTLEEYLVPRQLIIIKSTVGPGTTREFFNKLKPKFPGLMMAFCPERLAEGVALKDFETLPIIVGGVDEASANACFAFWEKVHKTDLIKVNSSEEAELAKLADNLWIDVNIALANELACLSDRLDCGIDVLSVIAAANTLKKGTGNVNILLPSAGVGGSCLTKDPVFLETLARQNSIDFKSSKFSRSVNDGMPAYSASLIATHFQAQASKLDKIKILVLGAAFKSNTGDLRMTPVTYFIEALKCEGFRDINLNDYLAQKSEIEGINCQILEDYEGVLKDVDCLCFMAGHDNYKKSLTEYFSKLKQGALVFDGRMYFPHNQIRVARELGHNFIGIGR